MTTSTPALAIDDTTTIDVNGSQQRVRLCAERAGLPPLLIVQHGPGFPLLHARGQPEVGTDKAIHADESLRRDTYDCHDHIVQPELSANDVRSRAEARLPGTVVHDRDGL